MCILHAAPVSCWYLLNNHQASVLITFVSNFSRMISRKHPLKASPHEILTVESISTAKLAKQTTVQMTNGWGIVRSIIDLVNRQDDGEYVLFKDPAKVICLFNSLVATLFIISHSF